MRSRATTGTALALLAAAFCVAATRARAEDSGAVARGAYLAAAAGCDQCHTAEGGAPYAGGRRLATRFGGVVAPNLTPDKATGIGNWTAADFVQAMHGGIAPDDTHFLPVFPYPYYAALSDGDLADLWAFLGSLAPVSRTETEAATAPALLDRAQAMIGVALRPPTAPWQPDPTHDGAWNRGAYLVATVGRCGECHTPHDALGQPEPDRFLAGSAAGPDGKKVPNITPEPETGIGKWSEDDIVTLLKEGQTPDVDFVGGAMAAIVKNTARLTDDDRRAIAVYLKTVAPKSLQAKR